VAASATPEANSKPFTETHVRSLLLFFLGIPIPIIILIALLVH